MSLTAMYMHEADRLRTLLGEANAKIKSLEKKLDQHPMQPVVLDPRAVARFKRNEIVCAFLDGARMDMNDIVLRVAQGSFSREDYTQFIQLIGYSVGAAGDLSLFDPDVFAKAETVAELLVRNVKERNSR